MELFQSLKTFLYTHRRKFIISGIVVGGSVAIFNVLKTVFEANQKHKISEFLENIRRQRHFETIQVTCDKTIISLGKRLEKEIVDILNIDAIVADLKKNSTNSLELWETLKISVFTQICLVVYAHTLIVFVMKIQFAIIGGYLYKNLNETNTQLDRNIQEQYFALCVDFMKDGLNDLLEFLKVKVINIVSGLDLTKPLTIQNIQDLFWSIQASVLNDEFVENIPYYLRIRAQMKTTSHPVLLQVYEETGDIICAKELTANCVNSLLNCGFTYVTQELLAVLSSSGKGDAGLPTVKMLPIMHNLIKSKMKEPDTSVWLQKLMKSEKLEILSANIYESYCW